MRKLEFFAISGFYNFVYYGLTYHYPQGVKNTDQQNENIRYLGLLVITHSEIIQELDDNSQLMVTLIYEE